MKAPSVSVLFLTYRQERFVEEALRAALAQDLQDYELIIADDASPDGTWSIIEKVLSEFTPCGVRVKLLRQPVNLGILGNFNAAAALATGDIFVCMAGDDISHLSRAREMVQAFSADPTLRVVNCAWRDVGATGMPIGGSSPDLRTRTFEHGSYRDDPFAGSPVIGACAAYHRSLWDVFGPLPSDAGGEDVDFLFRGLLLGRVLFLGKVLVDYRQHDGNLYNLSLAGLSLAEVVQREIRSSTARARFERQWRRDLLRASRLGHVEASRFRKIEHLIEKYTAQHELAVLSLKVAPFAEWCQAAWRLVCLGDLRRVRRQLFMRLSENRRKAYFNSIRSHSN